MSGKMKKRKPRRSSTTCMHACTTRLSLSLSLSLLLCSSCFFVLDLLKQLIFFWHSSLSRSLACLSGLSLAFTAHTYRILYYVRTTMRAYRKPYQTENKEKNHGMNGSRVHHVKVDRTLRR